MKIKLTLLPVTFDADKNIFDLDRNMILLDEDSCVISRYFYNESVEECINKLSLEYIKYTPEWIGYTIADFYRVSDQEFEVVYFGSFPYALGFSNKGKTLSLSDTEKLSSIGERYVRTLSEFTSTRYSTR
jgi:hypothetical protein